MSRIFVSHSGANLAEAITIRDWMIAQGWNDLFLDLDPEHGFKAGERWQQALKRAAENCELVVFLVSPAWAASKWCLAEYLFAKNLNKRIFAVMVESTPICELPAELTVEWQITDLTIGARDYHATVTLPDGKTADVAFSAKGLDRLRIGLMQSGLDPKHFAWPPENDPERPPYRGLLPLEADDAGIFFGREGAVNEALERLRALHAAPPPRLLVILGASGAGKSSLLRAGVIPRLARDDRRFVALPVIRPGPAVISGETGLLRALEGACRAAGLCVARANLRTAIDGGANELNAHLAAIAQAATPVAADPSTTPKARTVVLSIDQSEELFLAEGQQEAQRFLSLVRDLVTAEVPAVIALLAIRSDNYERLQIAKELEGVRQETLSLLPMPTGSYAEVIKGPARRLEGKRAIGIEDALIDALLADVESGGGKDALPLLAFTLERLYGEYGATGHLKLEHYKRLGRIEGSIEAAVEQAFQAGQANPDVPKERQEWLALLRRGLIPWLADIDPDTGAPRRRVARLSEIPGKAQPLIKLLIEQRLLSTDIATGDKEATVEPAHEVLLRQWGLLRSWLHEDTAHLNTLDGIKRAAREWAAHHRADTWLAHSGERMRPAERLRERPDLVAKLTPLEDCYLASCQRVEQAARAEARRQKLVIRAAAAAVALIILIPGGWLAYPRIRLLPIFWDVTVSTEDAEQLSKPGRRFFGCASCPEMVVVPAGRFTMGSNDFNEEKPPHEVTIPQPLAVGRFEVTFDEWDACVAHGGCKPVPDDMAWGRGTRPVINVAWQDAKAYVEWIAKLTGKPYRLLTEAEWEYAARAGNDQVYSWGDEIGNMNANCNGCGGELGGQKTAPVGSFPANAFGLHDMHGNVWEWVEDLWHANYEGAPTDGSEWVKGGDATRRVLRGGSWLTGPQYVRAASRSGDPDQPDRALGFRLARTLDR